MKKNTLLFALLFCAALIIPGVLKAQPAGKVIITNMTGCELHLVAVGSPSACGISYFSTMVSTAGTVVFDVSAGISGWGSSPALISGIYLYPVTGSCGSALPAYFPYGACPGFSTNLLAYSVSSSCVRCSRSQFNGVYTPPPFPGGTATLVFS